jgi:formate dehydrogenase (NADP+) beta subunit
MKRRDMTSPVDLTHELGEGPLCNRRPVYVDLSPPCNNACPSGENIQAWLDLAQAGKYRQASDVLTRDNSLPAVHGRVCYHPCETRCNRNELDAAVSIHAVERFLGDLAAAEGWMPAIEQLMTAGQAAIDDKYRTCEEMAGWASTCFHPETPALA